MEQRKVVTVLFCDVTGSTALGERLDPEALRALLARWFERMKAIVEAHGGSVEKFIGDAVMAVFGVPQLHEDDALRACRAALEMQAAMPGFGIEGRIGVMTGEVVAGTAERLVTGDAVNVAARLEQAAEPGEVLIGEPTLRLVRGAVEVEEVEPLRLKGKSAPVAAFRLAALASRAAPRAEGPIVGRADELRRLDELFAQVVRDRSCQLVTILGPAGVGKSRLAAEFLRRVDARVVAGRCLSYGEGITYWPVVEIVKRLGLRPEPESAAAAIAALLGESEQLTDPDDIAWAFRRTLETAAAREPLVCLLDDLHWGEPALLDLVQYVADVAQGAPILLLCLARPDLLDRRPAWAGILALEPLSPEDSHELLELRGGDDPDLRARIVTGAEGNPLFLEEMLALARESGDAEVQVPPTIQALLAARLDALDPAERTLLERGAVEGLLFHVRGLKALLDEGEVVTPRLQALVRRDLIRPTQPVVRGGDAYRFRHQLIRDAAYEALPKSTRAELHRSFGEWLAEAGTELVELDELVGYHLEQCCRYREALGGEAPRAVADEARRRLTAAARRAARRGDYHTAAQLGERAFDLLGPAEFDLELELDLQWALFYSGQIPRSVEWGTDARERAAAYGGPLDELCIRTSEALMQNFVEPEGSAARLRAIVDEALPVLSAAGHEVGLTSAWMAAWLAAMADGRADDSVEAADRVLELSRRCGRVTIEQVAIGAPAMSRAWGSMPAPEFLAWVATRDEATRRNGVVQSLEAVALATVGRVDEGREILDRWLDQLRDRPIAFTYAWALGCATEFALVAGDTAAVYELGREAVTVAEQIGDRANSPGILAALAEVACGLGRREEAEQALRRAEDAAAGGDLQARWLSRRAAARVHALRGELDEAERLAREAVELGERTQFLVEQARTYAVLAEVLALAGKADTAAEALEEAISRFERKGDVVGAARARALLPVAVT